MGSTRNKSSWRKSAGSALARLARLAQGGRHPGVLVAVLAVATIVGAFYVRHRWPELLASQQVVPITAEAFHVTPPPEWIHADVAAEVIRATHLTELNLFDHNLTSRVADAFAGHAWVAEVRRVSKQAGPRIDVELVYRRPVAMVEAVTSGEFVLVPIDEQSVLLPTESFLGSHEAEARNYLRIAIPQSPPAGPLGTAWGDTRVLGAARIAAAWQGEAWQSIGLYRIEVARDSSAGASGAKSNYVLYTRGGRRIFWGHAPGDETAGEPSAAEKIASLTAHVQASGPLDEHGTGDIDLCTAVRQ